MRCARLRRLEQEAHEAARFECLKSAEDLGLTMSCADEFECPSPSGCGFYQDAFANADAFDRMLP